MLAGHHHHTIVIGRLVPGPNARSDLPPCPLDDGKRTAIS